MSEHINQALRQLAEAREGLLAIGDDIWAEIDHRDALARRESVAFFDAYSDKVATLDALSAEITGMLNDYVASHAPAPRPDTPTNPTRAYPLDSDFTFKRPRGFSLAGEAMRPATTWRGMYQFVCRELNQADAKKFAALVTHPDYVSRQGRKMFSRDPRDLRFAVDIGQGLCAEGNYSANTLCDNMRRLLAYFGRDPRQMKVYLRPDSVEADDAEAPPL